MKYKYENVEHVEAKRDFQVFMFDDGEITSVTVVKKGTKGLVESMGWSSTDNFRVHYDILFTTDDDEIEVLIYEDKMDELLVLH